MFANLSNNMLTWFAKLDLTFLSITKAIWKSQRKLWIFMIVLGIFTTTFFILNSISGILWQKRFTRDSPYFLPLVPPKCLNKFVDTIKILYFRVGPQSDQLRFFRLNVFCLGGGKLRGKGRIKIFARCH